MMPPEIDRLAVAINALRPDWPASSLRTFIDAHLAGRALPDAAIALAWVACDPTSRTPKRVLESGPWWQATRPADRDSRPQPPPFTPDPTPPLSPIRVREWADVARQAAREALERPQDTANPAGGGTCVPRHETLPDRRTEPASHNEPGRTT